MFYKKQTLTLKLITSFTFVIDALLCVIRSYVCLQKHVKFNPMLFVFFFLEKCIVEFKISTQGSIGNKIEVIKQYFEKAVEMINLAAPFEVKYVRDGSITIGALLPVDILKNEEELKNAICIFLDQMVTNCNIETSMPEVVKVKIMILNHEQTGLSYANINIFLVV